MPVTLCDRLAADPEDMTRAIENGRPVAGVEIGRISRDAVAQCQTAVESNPDVARFHFQLGRAYVAAEDYARALEQMLLAADLGHNVARGDASYLLARRLKGITPDIARAIKVGLPAAEAGVVSAMMNVAFAYRLDNPGTQDFAQARAWYRRAADAGAEAAMFALGQLLETTNGGPRDIEGAKELYRRAAAKGHENSRKALQRLGN